MYSILFSQLDYVRYILKMNQIKVNSHQVLLSLKIAEMEYKYFCYVFKSLKHT